MEHDLKTWPFYFEAVLTGIKKHEIRVDDRGFACGDVLHLREWDPYETYRGDRLIQSPHYTGRELRVRVTYLTPGGEWGLPENVCVMSIEPLKEPRRGV